MMIGKHQRDILDVLQDDNAWTCGELWNDAGAWTVSSVDADGVRYGRRCQADPARRLYERGYVMHDRTEAGCGLFGADRVIYVLTEKGRKA